MNKTPFEKTLFDLDANIAKAAGGNANIDQLHEYSKCHYCIAYRKSLTASPKGVCDNCPAHKLGESLMGRKLPYNGCYKIPAYRTCMKESFLLARNTTRNPENFIEAAKCMKQTMFQFRDVIDLSSPHYDNRLP
jgi:hypothetical protein